MVQQTLAVSKRIFLQIIRSKWTIPYLIGFPAFFIAVYAFGFSASDVGANQTFLLGVINNDEGFNNDVKSLLANETITEKFFQSEFPQEVVEQGLAYEFILLLSNFQYNNEPNSKNIFKITELSNESDTTEKLENRELDIIIEFPSTFSNAILSAINHYWNIDQGIYLHEEIQVEFPDAPNLPLNENATIVVRGDDTFLNFQIARTVLSSILEAYLDPSIIYGPNTGSVSLTLDEENQVLLSKYSIFELIAPGLIIFGLVITPAMFATFIGVEFNPENRTFDRIQIAPISPISYTLGSLLVQIPIYFIQAVILFGVTLAFGFEPEGDLILGFCIALTIIPFTLALAYLAAAFFHDENVIGNILGFGSPVIGFASGAFISLPQIVIIPNLLPTPSNMTRDFLIWDLLPLTHSVNAIRIVLLYNFSLESVFFDIFLGFLFSTLLLICSIYIFTKRRF